MTGFDELRAAYEGVEGALDGREAIAAYRATMLERTAAQSALLARELGQAEAVVEVGTGNGRLLVDLARRGVVRRGLGIDLAASRIEFARAWAADEGLEALTFRREDALAAPLGSDLDAAIVITGAFAYFDAVADGTGAELLARLRAALRPGGRLVLELYPHPAWRALLETAQTTLRLWSELGPSDPWRFYLSELSLDPATQVLDHRKTFVHRSTGEVDDTRRESIRLYDVAEIEAQLRAAGFDGVRALEGWTDDAYAGGETLVVLAEAAR